MALAPAIGPHDDQGSISLPKGEGSSFFATGTYSDGTTVKWDQPPLPDGGEPEHPAPTLTLSTGPTPPHDHHPSPGGPANQGAASQQSKSADNAARLLGGAALIVGALGVCLVLLRRRT